MLAVDQPLSVSAGKPALYRVADTSLRLYLAVLRDVHNLSERGRSQAGFALFQNRWSSWRGRAVEPLMRASLEEAAVTGDLLAGSSGRGRLVEPAVRPEIDLIGADRGPLASTVHFGGSLKWLNTPFETHDLRQLRRGLEQVPGFDPEHSGLVVVSRSGTQLTEDVDLVWGPEDVVNAWRP